MAETLLGVSCFPTQSFDAHVETFYPLAVGLLAERDVGGSANAELRSGIAGFLRKVGEVRFGLAMPMAERERDSSRGESAATTPLVSPELGKEGRGFDWENQRRGSRGVR